MTDFKKLKVVELRAELAARNLTQTGKRDELIERLEEYEFHNAEVMEMEEPSAGEPVEPLLTKEPTEPILTKESSVEASIPVRLATPIPAIPAAVSPVTETISPVIASDTLSVEEEKRRQRALRFGLDVAETATVNIEIAVKRLEHALPARSRHHPHHQHRHRQHKNNARVNKA